MSGLLLLALLLGSAEALAVGVNAPGEARDDLERQIARLDSGTPAKRRLAARSLRSMVKAEVRRSAGRADDDLVVVEARMILQDLDVRLTPRCAQLLREPQLTRPCASILTRLESTNALPALQEALSLEGRPQARRSLQRAIQTLQAYAQEEKG